jgi:dihydropteroate synthase
VIWKIRRRELDLTRRGVVMGIVNVTPDSFSDGGEFLNPEAASSHGLSLVAEGAEILDIGGESTRPGSEGVSAEEETRRVLPVIQALRRATDTPISIDTSKSSVARAALEAGADIINDVTGLRGDPQMMALAAESRAGVVVMHMQGTPRTMQAAPSYNDVVTEVGEFFRHSIERAVASSLDPMSIALDPGIGFGKTPAHNLALLAGLKSFASLARPLLIGVSRKSLLGHLANSSAMEDRLWPGVVLTALCRERGARIFRVHEAKPHVLALRTAEALQSNV